MTQGLEAQQKSFARNPDDLRAFESLEEHFFLEGDWPALVRVYRARIAAPSVAGDPAQYAALLFRLGQVLEDRVLDLDAACETYWTLARLDRTNRPALRQLRGIHARRGQWDMVLQLAELESATAMPPFERARFEAELGHIWQHALRDPAEAERAYDRALEHDPELPAALEGKATLCVELGRLEEAAAAYQRLTARLRGPERAPFWVALGRLQAIHLNQHDAARASFAAALDDDPMRTAAVEWSLLLATEAEDWSAVAGLLEHRFDLASGARHRAAIAVEASQIHLHSCRSPAGARVWIERAWEMADDDAAVLRARADVERAEGNDALVATLLERLIDKAGPRVPRALRIELAEALARAGRSEAALAALDALAADRQRPNGTDIQVLELRAVLLRATGAKRELAEVLETIVGVEGGPARDRRSDRQLELARIYEEDLDDLAAAEPHWRAVHADDPRRPESFDALERIARKRDDAAALRALYETALAVGGPHPAARVHERLGTLQLETFSDPSGARVAFETALGLDPRAAGALEGLRRIASQTNDPALELAVCEREAAICEAPDAYWPIAERAIALLLEREEHPQAYEWVLRASEREGDLRGLLERRAEIEGRLGLASEEIATRARLAPLLGPGDRGRSAFRRAELLRAVGDLAQAAEEFEAAHALTPDRIEILEALVEVHRALEQTTDEARCLRLLAERANEARLLPVLERLAELLQDPIGDLEGAIAARQRLIALPGAPHRAFTALESLLELAGRHDALAALLESERRDLADNAPEARELDLRRGRILLDALGDCEGAAAIFSALHAREPENETILGLLERALRAGHDAAGLVDLLARRASWTESAALRGALLLERAQLLELVLGRPHEACDAYATVAEVEPGSPAALQARDRLEVLCEATGQWTRLQTLLLARLERTPETDQAALRLRLAEILRDQLQDPAACAAQLERVVALHPGRVHIWQQLQDLYTRVLDRPEQWLRVARAELSTAPAPRRELVLQIAIGRLLLDPAHRPRGTGAREAIDCYVRAFALDPSHAEAAEVLASHYERENRPEELASLLSAHLRCLDAARAHERHALRVRLARVTARDLGDDRTACALLESVQEARGASPEAAELLAEIYERSSDGDAGPKLAALARTMLEQLPNERRRLPWRIRLGRAWVRCGDLEQAIEAYSAALTESPANREIEDALIELYERRSERVPLLELLERRLAFASAESELALRLRLAEHYAEVAEEAPRAFAHLEAILERVPHHRDALERALALAPRIADPARLRALFDRALALPQSAALRARLLELRGLLPCEGPEAEEQSITDLREALLHDPARTSVRRTLRARLAALERWPAVLDCLATEAAAAAGADREALLEEAASLAERTLSPDAALPWLARLRVERPDDVALWRRTADLHRRAGRDEAALRALDAELALTPEPERRLALTLERAVLLETKLDSPGRAVLAYRSALALAPDRSPILAELDRLLEPLGRPLERAEILEERVASLPGREGIALRRSLAELYCVALAKPEQALIHLEANVAAARGDSAEELVHLGALAAALRACNREAEWAAIAERELALIDGTSALRAQTPIDYQRFLREEVARILDELLGDPERALERLRELCDDPAIARSALPTRIADRLHELLRRTARTAELADRLARHVERPEATARHFFELAALRETQTSDWTAAFAAYGEAARDPGLRLEAVRGRRRCAERLHDDAAIAETLRAELDHEPLLPRAERAALARRLGEHTWHRLGQSEPACAALATALELDPRDRAALALQIEITETRGERSATIDLLRRDLALMESGTSGADARARALQRVARLHALAETEIESAIHAYREAQEIARLPADDEHALARLLDRTGAFGEFAASFGRWCDREDGGATAHDHLALAERLAAAGDPLAARARAERAVAVAPEHASAWALLGRLQREAGENEAAIASFERAAAHALPIEAARWLVDAGCVAEAAEPERAQAFFERAASADIASYGAHAASTRVADRRGDPETTLRHAELALDLATHRDVAPEQRLALALAGGRAARRLGRSGATLRLFQIAHALAPDRPEAQDGLAEAHFESGDLAATRTILEQRLTAPPVADERPRQLALLGRALEAAGELDAAAARLAQAIELDPRLDFAHECLVRVEERAAQTQRARAALTRWSQQSADPALRARAALRAAEYAIAEGDELAARDQLAFATDADPELGEAWVLACDLAARSESEAVVRNLCERALQAIDPGVHSARIALRLARLHEIAGERPAAMARYGEAWRWDPRCSEAALCESRLARTAGDWIEADGLLSRFLAAHPDPESTSLAQVHLERGRLLSGPLEAFDDAITTYRRALALQPGLAVAKSALAGLLLHSPEHAREALALHREILVASPTQAASLRALAALAERQGRSEVAESARCIEAALGLASEVDAGKAPTNLAISLQTGPTLAHVEAERLRRLAHLLRQELPRILAADVAPKGPAADLAESKGLPVAAILALEDELAAPSLSLVPSERRAALFGSLWGLLLDPGGNGGEPPLRDALDGALGLWTRRKVRKIVEETSAEAIAAFDHDLFAHELRALAAALHLDRERGALRPVLLALLALAPGNDPGDEPFATELAGRVTSCEPARRLLVRITNALCDRLERNR